MSTKERLVEAGTRLVAERGYANVTVGDIEEAAGLVPRRGGLYKHFASKTTLVEEALTLRIERVHHLRQQANELADLPTPEALRDTAKAVLAELDEERDLFRIFEIDGQRFETQRERFFREIVEVGFLYAQMAFQRIADHHARHVEAADLATVALSALVSHRRTQWTFRATASGLDDERFLDAWMTLVWGAIGSTAEGTTRGQL